MAKVRGTDAVGGGGTAKNTGYTYPGASNSKSYSYPGTGSSSKSSSSSSSKPSSSSGGAGTKTITTNRTVLTGDQRPSYQSGTNQATKTTTKTVTSTKTVITGDQRPSYQKGNSSSSKTTSNKANTKSTTKGVSGDQSSRDAAKKIADYDSQNKVNQKSSSSSKKTSNPSSPKNPSSPSSPSSPKNPSNSGSSSKSGSKATANMKVGVSSISVSTATATAVKAPVKSTQNLTAKQITTWKNKVDTAISKNLITSLKKAYEDAVALDKATESGQDANNLNYRFKDLAKVLNQSTTKLTEFMKTFDSSLTTYITKTEAAEKQAAEKIKKSIDQFAESAAKISKLKM